MYKIILLLIICCSLHSMQKPKERKRKVSTENSQTSDSVQCPYCSSRQDSLETHLRNYHKIDRAVISECARAITGYNAIKKSYYKIAALPCECNQFFSGKKALARHQRGTNCPINHPVATSYSSHFMLTKQSIKQEPADSSSPLIQAISESPERVDYFGDTLFEEIIYSQSMKQ